MCLSRFRRPAAIGIAILGAAFASSALLPRAHANLIPNADFSAGLEGWVPSGTRSAYRALKEAGMIEFTPPSQPANTHVDCVLKLEPESFYFASVQVRADSGLASPALRIADEDWGRFP